jgi:hypothetical protein
MYLIGLQSRTARIQDLGKRYERLLTGAEEAQKNTARDFFPFGPEASRGPILRFGLHRRIKHTGLLLHPAGNRSLIPKKTIV